MVVVPSLYLISIAQDLNAERLLKSTRKDFIEEIACRTHENTVRGNKLCKLNAARVEDTAKSYTVLDRRNTFPRLFKADMHIPNVYGV